MPSHPCGATPVPKRTFLQGYLLVLTALAAASCGGEDPVGIEEEEESASVSTSEIATPARNAFLVAGTTDDVTINVEGEACDATNQIVSVVLNGSSLALTGSGDCRSFSTGLNSSWGLNALRGLVTNDLGNEVALVQSYLRSPEYFVSPPAPAGISRAPGDVLGIPNAFRARLGQEAIDDGDRGDIDDLVSVINLVLDAAEPSLNTVINNAIRTPLYRTVVTTEHQCLLQTRTQREGIDFRADGLLRGGIELIGLTTADGEIEVDFILDIRMPLAVAGYLDNGCFGELIASGTGSVAAPATRIGATLSVETVGDQIEIQVATVDVTVGAVVVDVELNGLIGWFDGFIGSALSFVGTAFGLILEEALLLAFEEELMPEMRTVLGMDVFSLDLGGVELLGVTVVGEASTDLVVVGDGFIDYGVTVNVVPSAYAKTPEQLRAGTIMRASMLPAFDGMNGSFGLGLKHDFVNQVFWAFWAGGGFDFEDIDDALGTLNDALPAAGVTITSMEMLLPPVLMPGDTEAEVKIGVGGIELLADVVQSAPSLFAGQPAITVTTPLTLHVSVFLTATLDLDPVSRRLAFDIVNDAEIAVQIENALRTDEITELESMFADAVEELLGELIPDVGGSIVLPSIEVGNINGVPAGLTWVLDEGVSDQSSGYLRIIGSVGIKN